MEPSTDQPTDGPPRIFISYARSDGEQIARSLRQRLEKAGFRLWQDRRDMEGGKDWWQQIEEAMGQVEYLILVMTQAALDSEVVRNEWRLARQRGVCVLPVMGWPELSLKRLSRWMRNIHFVNPEVPEEWERLLATLNKPCSGIRVPSVKDLSEHVVSRPNEFGQLINALLNSDGEYHVGVTVALRGAGGYGKTTLVRALCRDERIKEAFYHGILWVTLGEQPGDLTVRVLDLIEAVTGKRPRFATLEFAIDHFTQLLGDRHLLLVIDDVWKASHLDPFVKLGRCGARLITTRNSNVLPADARALDVGPMLPTEAAAVLRADLPHCEDAVFKSLVHRLGKWPMLLKLVNRVLLKRVRDYKEPLAGALVSVQQALDRKGLTAFDAHNAEERHQAVSKTIALSLDLLVEDERERYRELAIFPEDIDIPLMTVARLWNATGTLDELETEELCLRLSELSLLLYLDLEQRVLRLHDVLRAYLQESFISRVRSVHERFLQTYQVAHWAEVDHQERYLYRHLPYHLCQAGRQADLKRLLLSFDWIWAKLEVTEVTSVLVDFDWHPHDDSLNLVKGAISLSAHVLAEDKSQLAGQLIGRLADSKYPDVKQVVTEATRYGGYPWLRPLYGSLTPPGSSLQRTLIGHTDHVGAVAVTPDGKRVISACDDGTLKLWDMDTGQEEHTLNGHTAAVRALAVTPDGRRVISASWDQTIKIWDLATRQEERTLTGHTNTVTAITVTPNGHRIIAGTLDGALKIIDLRTGQDERTLKNHQGWISAVAVTPDGRRALSASADQTVKIWDLDTGEESTLTGHTNWVEALAVTPDGNRAVSASRDRTLKIWDLSTAQKKCKSSGHTQPVTAVAVTPDNRRVISASRDHTVKIWNLKTGQQERALSGHANGVEGIAVTPDGRRIVSASQDCTLKIWDLWTGQELCTLRGHTDAVKAVAVTPDGRRAVSASWDQTLKIWDLSTGLEERTMKGHHSWVRAVAVTSDGRRAVSASWDQTVKVWDLLTGKEEHTLSGHTEAVRAVAVTPDGQHVISASWDHTVKVWILLTGKEERRLLGHSSSVDAVAVTADGRRILSSSRDRTLRVWDFMTGIEQCRFTVDGDAWACTSAPDGLHYIVGDTSGTVHFLRLVDGSYSNWQNLISILRLNLLRFLVSCNFKNIVRDRHWESQNRKGPPRRA